MIAPLAGVPGWSVPVDQLMICEERTGRFFHRVLQIGVKKDQVRRWLRALRLKPPLDVQLNCSADRYHHLRELVLSVFPGRWRDKGSQDPGTTRVASHAKCVYSTDLFRAVAKVAFHHSLAWTSGYSGREEMYVMVRDFIQSGKGVADKIVSCRYGAVPRELVGGAIIRPLKNFVAVNQRDNQITVDVVFLQCGSDPGIGYTVNLTPAYCITIDPSPRRCSWVYLYWRNPAGRLRGELCVVRSRMTVGHGVAPHSWPRMCGDVYLE